MTKKDFELIARVIANYRNEIPGTARKDNAASEIAHRFAEELKKTNPRFDVDRFVKACGNA